MASRVYNQVRPRLNLSPAHLSIIRLICRAAQQGPVMTAHVPVLEINHSPIMKTV